MAELLEFLAKAASTYILTVEINDCLSGATRVVVFVFTIFLVFFIAFMSGYLTLKFISILKCLLIIKYSSMLQFLAFLRFQARSLHIVPILSAVFWLVRISCNLTVCFSMFLAV